MSRSIRALVIGGGLVAAALFGALVVAPGEADAQITVIPSGTACPVTGCPTPTPNPDGCLTLHGTTLCPPGVTPPSEDGLDGEKVEAVTCHIDGCEIPVRFVGDDGETLKVMVISFKDPEPDDTDD